MPADSGEILDDTADRREAYGTNKGLNRLCPQAVTMPSRAAIWRPVATGRGCTSVEPSPLMPLVIHQYRGEQSRSVSVTNRPGVVA